MIVIGHLAPGVDSPVVALAALGQGFQPGYAVDVIDKDILAPIPARGHVVETAREFEPQRTGHARSLDQAATKTLSCFLSATEFDARRLDAQPNGVGEIKCPSLCSSHVFCHPALWSVLGYRCVFWGGRFRQGQQGSALAWP